jgi:hypothetical protein
VNTGVPSGLDLDRNGETSAAIGRDRGNDAWGYGLHPGPVRHAGAVALPDRRSQRRAHLPVAALERDARRAPDPIESRPPAQPFHTDHAVWTQLRLSSKSHWDVPIAHPGGTLHFLVSHPTPPVFDGPENRNGAAQRRRDPAVARIHLARQTRGGCATTLGRCGGSPRRCALRDRRRPQQRSGGWRRPPRCAIVELLEHPRVLRMATPRSAGGEDKSARLRRQGHAARGAPAHVTGDFGPRATAPCGWTTCCHPPAFAPAGSGVFWPRRAIRRGHRRRQRPPPGLGRPAL